MTELLKKEFLHHRTELLKAGFSPFWDIASETDDLPRTPFWDSTYKKARVLLSRNSLLKQRSFPFWDSASNTYKLLRLGTALLKQRISSILGQCFCNTGWDFTADTSSSEVSANEHPREPLNLIRGKWALSGSWLLIRTVYSFLSVEIMMLQP